MYFTWVFKEDQQNIITVQIPIWNCVVATTPEGNTTLGQAAEAVLNDLGVLAEHLLVYLNANGELTYEEDIKNDFVSLANPLYPTGPRLNISIDFASVAKDAPLLEVRMSQNQTHNSMFIGNPVIRIMLCSLFLEHQHLHRRHQHLQLLPTRQVLRALYQHQQL